MFGLSLSNSIKGKCGEENRKGWTKEIRGSGVGGKSRGASGRFKDYRFPVGHTEGQGENRKKKGKTEGMLIEDSNGRVEGKIAKRVKKSRWTKYRRDGDDLHEKAGGE